MSFNTSKLHYISQSICLSTLSVVSYKIFLLPSTLAIVLSDAGIYGAVYLAVNLLSSVLTNNAEAVLSLPIAMSAVEQTGTDRLKMAFIVMLAASDYITSFGYQTNLMVYGPGEYSNMDFLRFGAPMQLLLWLSSTMVSTSTPDNWYVSWMVCFVGFFVVVFVRFMHAPFSQWVQKQWGPPFPQIITEDPPTSSGGPDVATKLNSSWHFRRNPADQSPSILGNFIHF